LGKMRLPRQKVQRLAGTLMKHCETFDLYRNGRVSKS
jgi:hypothetical protein